MSIGKVHYKCTFAMYIINVLLHYPQVSSWGSRGWKTMCFAQTIEGLHLRVRSCYLLTILGENMTAQESEVLSIVCATHY
jgi:hypothetical protein